MSAAGVRRALDLALRVALGAAAGAMAYLFLRYGTGDATKVVFLAVLGLTGLHLTVQRTTARLDTLPKSG